MQLSVSISGGHTFGFLGRGAAAKTDRPIYLQLYKTQVRVASVNCGFRFMSDLGGGRKIDSDSNFG